MHILSSFSVSVPLALGKTQNVLSNPVTRACAELSVLQVSVGASWLRAQDNSGLGAALPILSLQKGLTALSQPLLHLCHCKQSSEAPGQGGSSKLCSLFLCMNWSPPQGSTAKCGISFVPLLSVQTERDGKMVLIFT